MFLLANLKFQIIMKQNIENVDKQFRSAQSDTLLAKNAENQTNISNCDHVQLGGQAYYDEKKFFMFIPDDPVVGAAVPRHGHGPADVGRHVRLRAQAEAETQVDAYQEAGPRPPLGHLRRGRAADAEGVQDRGPQHQGNHHQGGKGGL